MLRWHTLLINVYENTRTMPLDVAASRPNTDEQRVHRKIGSGTISRCLLALFFAVAGLMHFIFPQAYINVMPPWLGWHAALVFVSGIAECAGGIGVLWRPARPYAGWGLLVLCVAVLPANIHMLVDAVARDKAGWIIILLALRLPLQLLLMRWIWLAAHLQSKSGADYPSEPAK